MTEEKRKKKSLRRRLVVAVGAGLLAAVAFEVLFRVAAGPVFYHSGGNIEYDASFGFRQVPGSATRGQDELGNYEYRFNELGFRGPLPPSGREPKPPGVDRLLFLGDSFLKAHAVRDGRVMPEVARDLVAERGAEVEAYSLACSDYGTAQELLLLREYGEEADPDAIVLVMYPHNDVANNGFELAGLTSASAGDYLRPYLVPGDGLEQRHLHPWRAATRSWSVAFRHLERALLVYGAENDVERLRMYPERPQKWVAQRIKRGLPPRPFEAIFQEQPGDSPWADAWHTTEVLLRSFAAEAAALDARFLLLVIPSRQQVQHHGPGIHLQNQFREYTGSDVDESLDWNLPEERLVAFCEREDIEARFLLDPLRRGAATDTGLYALDAHLAWPGHALAGAEVAAWYLGEASPGGADAVTTSSPTPLGEDDELSWLDFGEEKSDAYLVDGWRRIRSPVTGTSRPGRKLTRYGTFVFPARAQDFVLRGFLPEEAPLPQVLSLKRLGKKYVQTRIETHGPFEIFVSASSLEPDLRDGEPRYFSFTLRLDRPGPFGVLVHEAGYLPEE